MKNNDLTKGPIFKKIILFALPMILGNLLQQIYNLADTLIVGRALGSNALASVGAVYTLMTFITSVIIGLCMGSGAIYSHDFGQKDEASLKKNIWHSFWFIFAITILIYLIIYPGVNWIISLLRIPDEIIDMTKEYILYVFIGIIFTFLYNFFAYLLKAIGDSLTPLIFLGISCLFNIGLDIWFVIGLNLGVMGAAVATVIAQALSGIGLMIYSFIKLPILHKIDKTFDGNRLLHIMGFDASTCAQQSIMNLGILMIQSLVNSFGTTIMAAFAAAVKIDTLAYMPAQEFGNAYSLFISQNHGAKEDERIKKGTKISFLVSTIFCLVISIFIFFMANILMGIFVDTKEVEIINEGVKYLRIEGSMYIGIGILFLWYGYFRGINKPLISLILTIISLGLRVLLSYTLAPYTSLNEIAIWISIPIGWVVADIAGLIFYLLKSKKPISNS